MVTKIRKKTLDISDQQRLAEQAKSALQSSMWALPRTLSPLTDAEMTFMRTHTLDQILAARTQSISPLCQFLVQVVAAVASEFATQAFENAVKRPDSVVSSLTVENENEQQKTTNRSTEISTKKTSAIFANPATQSQTKVTTARVITPSENSDVLISEKPQYAPGKNPEIEHMTKATEGKFKGLLIRASREFGDRISNPDTQRLYEEISTSVGVAVKAASFTNKLHETNFVHATTELVKDVLIGKFASLSGKALAQMVSATNPAGLAALISFTVKDVLTPTETAPDSHDTRPAVRLPIAIPRGSMIPELVPPYSAYRAP